MKQLFYIMIASFILVGAGCFGGNRDESWSLSFELPEGWVQYAAGDQGFAGNPSAEITPNTPEVAVQSTENSIYISGETERAEYREKPVQSEDYTVIRAFKLDPRRVIDDEAEDLGKGFYRLKKCEEGENCQEGGAHNYIYYFEKGPSKYQFIIITNGQSVEAAEEVILSAKPVRIK